MAVATGGCMCVVSAGSGIQTNFSFNSEREQLHLFCTDSEII